MNKYIESLTDHLIGTLKFREMFRKYQLVHNICQDPDGPATFLNHMSVAIQVNALMVMTPETLGKIACSFEQEDIDVSEVDIFKSHNVHIRTFGLYFQTNLSIALAYVIYGRLSGRIKSQIHPSPNAEPRQKTDEELIVEIVDELKKINPILFDASTAWRIIKQKFIDRPKPSNLVSRMKELF